MPADFWLHESFGLALSDRHMGQVVRVYRHHPVHGRRPLPQSEVGAWCGITQAQLSRIESGPPIVHLDRLLHWARVLRIPERHLWFALPYQPDQERPVDPMKRSDFLLLGGAAVATALTAPFENLSSSAPSPQDCAQELAWELWRSKALAVHPAELPSPIASGLSRLAREPGSAISRDVDGAFSFAHVSFIDFFVAQRVFGGIAADDGHLLATAQTSHDTDYVIREFVSRQPACVGTLTGWMSTAASPLLRVNSAGILAKLGTADAANTVITALRRDGDTRRLYLTAVVQRVLSTSWKEAARLAAGVEGDAHAPAGQLSPDLAGHLAARFGEEVANPRDGAARWCAVTMLAQVQPSAPDAVRDTLHRALRREPARENLRAIGTVLAGVSPLSR